MRISECFGGGRPAFSLEIFPPKNPGDLNVLYGTLEAIADLKPDFVSVTYSAGGSEGGRSTVDIASRIRSRHGIEALAHLTCITADRTKIREYLTAARSAGVGNILALRGDLPQNGVLPEAPDFRHASDLIREIKAFDSAFCVGAAAYPESHVDSEDAETDLDFLKAKVDAGADFLISQLCFENDLFLRFRDRAAAKGISVPLAAGIMPILSRGQIEKMIFLCGASLPARIVRILHRYAGNPEDLVKAGIEYAGEQIRGLIREGVDGVHIYTMNRPEIARRCRVHWAEALESK